MLGSAFRLFNLNEVIDVQQLGILDEKGVECGRYELSPAIGNMVLQIPAGQWHMLIPREPSVILEAKDGGMSLFWELTFGRGNRCRLY